MLRTLPLLLGGCVLAVSGTTTIDEPFERVVVDVGKGDVRVLGRPGDATLSIDFGGLASGEVGHRVEEGALLVDYTCDGPDLCGGDLEIRVPPRTAVEVSLGAGELEIDGLRGELVARVDAGSAALAFQVAPDTIDVAVTAGAIEILLPPGAYALDLEAAGPIDVDPAIVDDPASTHTVKAEAGAGPIGIRASGA